MAACLKCGQKYESDFLLWKGGIGRCLCPNCLDREIQENKMDNGNNKNYPQTYDIDM